MVKKFQNVINVGFRCDENIKEMITECCGLLTLQKKTCYNISTFIKEAIYEKIDRVKAEKENG